MSAFNFGQLLGIVILVLIVIGVVRELMKRSRGGSASESGVTNDAHRPAPPPPDPPSSPGVHGYDQPGGPPA